MTIPLEKGLRELWKKGFQVSQAESVKKGIESVKQSCPGFAVVDLRLGDGNGLEVVKEIKKIGPESRVIMLTDMVIFQQQLQQLKMEQSTIWQNLRMQKMLKKRY